MTPRDWTCPTCGSRFATGAAGELVEYALTEARCLGCRRLWAILAASSHQRALVLAALPTAAPVLTRTEIDTRLRQIRPEAPQFDYAKAAANNRDED
jgi:hypothetical protein